MSERTVEKIVCPPDWYINYVDHVTTMPGGLVEEINAIAELPLAKVEARLGGPLAEIPYEFLQVIFPSGSGDSKVAEILSTKRGPYLIIHPEARKSKPVDGVFGFDGRYWSKDAYEKMTDEQRHDVMVGSTCSHEGSGAADKWRNPDSYLKEDWPSRE